ncbi:hypothetical protein MBLNU457_6716t1 [Dothideomycetes sp. NU457]
MPSRNKPVDLEVDEAPTTINPYKVLSLEKDATPDQVKTAYRKAALKHHPDKASPEDKDTAHTKFQEIAFAYAVLSDERRRKRYDTTGRTEETLDLEDDEFDWSTFYREQYANVITSEAIEKFSNEFKGSEEEKDAILQAYTESEGDMDFVYESVMLSDPAEDDERFRQIIKTAIKDGEVEAYTAFTKESKKSIQARIKAAKGESKEVEEHAKELGIHDKLFGKKSKKSDDGEAGLAALIQQRQKSREANFLADLEAKYAPKDKKGKKRAEPMDGPSEEMFERNRKKGKAKKA